MYNNFLSANAFQGYSLHTLFVQPYEEGKENIKHCFKKNYYQDNQEPYRSYGLIERTTHLLTGVLLCIPLVNTITELFLRLFNTDLDEKISDFIDEFVFPYVHGNLDAKDPAREGLITALKKRLSKDDIRWNDGIRLRALELYIKKNYQIVDQMNTTPDYLKNRFEANKATMKTALEITLPIDFPDVKFNNKLKNIIDSASKKTHAETEEELTRRANVNLFRRQ